MNIPCKKKKDGSRRDAVFFSSILIVDENVFFSFERRILMTPSRLEKTSSFLHNNKTDGGDDSRTHVAGLIIGSKKL